MSRYCLGSIPTFLVAAGLLGIVLPVTAETPRLKITTKHGSPLEERKLQQIERLAGQYDLKKYTITRRILIEQNVRAHSSPVLTLNPRFLNNDDLALAVYIHEQGHWVLMQYHRGQIRDLYADLKRVVRGLPSRYPQGSGDDRDTYLHLAVIMLEWQGLEQFVGAERALKAMNVLKADHYTAIYSAVLEHRAALENVLRRYSVRW